MHSPAWVWKLISLMKPTWLTLALPLLEATTASLSWFDPKAGAWLNPWGNGWHEALLGNLWMWTEPPLSAPQSERAQRAWLSKQHPAPSELRSRHNTERYRPGKHPPNQTKVPCPQEKQQKVRRHRPDLAFPRVSPSSALHPEQGQVTFYCRWLGDMNRKLDWLQNTETWNYFHIQTAWQS